MKFRNLSVLLFAAACGGGGGTDPQPVDSPTTDGGGFFPNSRNDVFLITFPEAGLTATLTPDEGDAPDNATAVNIGQTGGSGISGEMGIAGDHSDDYFERDTFLISTGANVNQLTVRMDWDGGQADMDWVLFEEPATGATDFTLFGSGTLISDGVDADGVPQGEFVTFTVDPSKNYLLWGGVFNVLSAGGAPQLPKPYDMSIYGANVTGETNGTCDVTEAANGDNGAGNNNIVAFGGTGTRIANALAVTTGAPKTFCGSLNTGNFKLVPQDPPDPASVAGTDDVDGFAFNMPVDGDLLVTVTGKDAAATAAIQGLLATGALQVALFNDPCVGNTCTDTDTTVTGIQPRPQQFFGGSLTTFIGTHGVEAFRMINSATVDPEETTDIVGPKTIAIFMQSDSPGILTANIDYKIHVEVDNRATRAGRIAAPELAEANDN